jgi:hypothetical protein
MIKADEHPESDDAEHDTLGGVAPAELVDRERQRLGEHGAEVAVDDLYGAQQAEDRCGVRREAIGWRPPVGKTVLTVADRSSDGPGEEPTPDGDREPVGRGLDDIVASVRSGGGSPERAS